MEDLGGMVPCMKIHLITWFHVLFHWSLKDSDADDISNIPKYNIANYIIQTENEVCAKMKMN